MRVVLAHPRVRTVVTESWSLWNPGDTVFPFDLNSPAQPARHSADILGLTQSIKRTLDIEADKDDLDFASFRFPANFEVLHDIDSSRMRTLRLSNCTNVGYLFNGLLCNIDSIRLKSLVISQEGLEANTGYSGKAKIECFLAVHKGLEVVEFTNMGVNMPSLHAILAQGSTLREIRLVETKRKKNSGFEKLPYEYDLEEHVSIQDRCPRLQYLVVDLESNVSKSKIEVSWDARTETNLDSANE